MTAADLSTGSVRLIAPAAAHFLAGRCPFVLSPWIKWSVRTGDRGQCQSVQLKMHITAVFPLRGKGQPFTMILFPSGRPFPLLSVPFLAFCFSNFLFFFVGWGSGLLLSSMKRSNAVVIWQGRDLWNRNVAAAHICKAVVCEFIL